MILALTKGKVTEIDDEDFEKVNQYKWHYNETGYAQAKVKINGKRVTTGLHRFLLDLPKNLVVDHIDGNPLNNKRSNLRVCSQRMNMHNQARNRNEGHSQYDPSINRWVAFISAGPHTFVLGEFATEQQAEAKWHEVIERPAYSVNGVKV